MVHDPAPEPPREWQGIASGTVLMVGLGTLAMTLALLGLVWWFMGAVGTRDAGFGGVAPFASPRLQSDPAGDLRRYRQEQRTALQSYAWVDRGRGLARIPIKRAMEIIAARGDAAYAPLVPPHVPDPRR